LSAVHQILHKPETGIGLADLDSDHLLNLENTFWLLIVSSEADHRLTLENSASTVNIQ
jgi:hypothetical protein